VTLEGAAPLLELKGLTKTFAGTAALDGLDLVAEAGEVHGIVGANGAGKSTLMNLLAGVFPPSVGKILIDGRAVAFSSPRDAAARGVSIVYQDLTTIPHLTVAENVFLGREPRGRFGRLDRAALLRETERLAKRWNLSLEPDRPVGELSVARQQLVELARALSVDARILILDEPSAVLSLTERDALFAIITELKRRGLLVLYVSHHLDEVFEIADRVTVLRNGRKIGTHPIGGLDRPMLVRMMVGHDVQDRFDLPPLEAAPTAMRAEVDLGRGAFSLAVRRGEILGIAGSVGSGRTRLARALAGLDPTASVRVEVDGRAVPMRFPADAVRNGVVYLTEDRKGDGLFLDLSVLANVSAASLDRFSVAGFRRSGAERSAAASVAQRLRLIARSLGAPARQLSGGNQQKLLFGRALLARPRILLCDEPTRGVDVGAKDQIYSLLLELAAGGLAIVLISSELKELIALSHRILVVRDRRVTEQLPSASDEHMIFLATTGFASTRAGDLALPSPASDQSDH
jgi:ABC-type sugar transport system ATPase subunit